MSPLPPAIPAATLIIMRPGPAGVPELLMMERTATMAFAAGALVFPGGRIDPQDHALAAMLGDAPEDAAARVAAIRETIEETGLAPGLVPAPTAAVAEALRNELAAEKPFAHALERAGLSFDLAALTPFARWCPNFRETRRFDTMFYVVEAPPGMAAGAAQASEATRLLWTTARQVLDEADAGRVQIIFPTRRNLERLARFGSIEEARADAAAHSIQKITPWVEDRGGRPWVCIPEGIGYPITAEPLETARRR
jgi:8-oxo-dGTP pyrophosphatase MutT (NUDIX family)